MEIVLISDGPLPLDSPVRKLPFFFPARLIDMSKVSAETVGDGKVAVIELLDATDVGLKALKASWESIAEIPVICLVSQKNRKEVIQAGALGKTETLERDAPFALLLRRTKTLLKADVCKVLPENTPSRTVEAYKSSNAFLESLCLSSAEGSKIRVTLMNESAEEMFAALSSDGWAAWLGAVQTHHSGTYSHTLRVAGLAGMLARHLGWSDTVCKEIIAGGLVHDIGKMRIPLSILDKTGKLTKDERVLIKRHPMFGRDMLKSRLEVSVDIKRMAIQHHEYLDGSGYPDGLAGDRISPKVRLITVCDIFTALTEERPYKETFPARTALTMLKDMGPKLDQKMVAQLGSMLFGQQLGAVSRLSAQSKGNAAA
ncbi:MAG: HD-GYP domain-containing protein [Roseibium sp.]|uniref:HD-GYP domain-containing protein n=1 Tax=Roseibium sp. TaxID=1936156 RepID=UPI002627FA0B|nr:HD-GYP domain-containing protein [Roseibium sp.]MCV0423891.1 HD-GYP domain-containing protein [Roseibium sp.]